MSSGRVVVRNTWPSLLAQEREERGRPRAIELARDVVEQEEGPHAARSRRSTSISADFEREDDGPVLPLRRHAAHRSPVELEREVVAMRPDAGRRLARVRDARSCASASRNASASAGRSGRVARPRARAPARAMRANARRRRGGQPLGRLARATSHEREPVAHHELLPLVEVRRRDAPRLEHPLPRPHARVAYALELGERRRRARRARSGRAAAVARARPRRQRDRSGMKDDDRRPHGVRRQRRRALAVDPRDARARVAARRSARARSPSSTNARPHARDSSAVPRRGRPASTSGSSATSRAT